MGRKIDIKKIEDTTKCQVTFSKRRSSLMKKANEIAICCDVDVAFVAFSPSGRISKYCNQKRIEDVLHRYVNLSADQRLIHISDVQGKMEKLKHLMHIKGDTSKLHYLDKQIENLELQIKKSSLELQISEADLRDYELDPEQEPSLHLLSWCERNLTQSLQKVIAVKNAFLSASASFKQPNFKINQIQLEENQHINIPFPSSMKENELASLVQNSSMGEFLMQLDPWTSPHSAKARENLFHNVFDHASITPDSNPGPTNISNTAIPSNYLQFPESSAVDKSGLVLSLDSQFSPYQFPRQQSTMVDPLNLPKQNNVTFPDAIRIIPQSLCNIPPPSLSLLNNMGGMHVDNSLYDASQDGLPGGNVSISQFANMTGDERGQFSYMANDPNVSNRNTPKDNTKENSTRTMFNEMHKVDQAQAYYNEVCEDTSLDNLVSEDIIQGNQPWASKIQKSDIWEWEEFLIDDNSNPREFPK